MSYHNDHLGTPQKLTDTSGAVVWSADYKPFGETTIIVSTITNNLRFPGQYYDAETGLNYNYYRDYNSVIGRYIEADPIGLKGGINLYVYVKDNPINGSDPLGLFKIVGDCNCKNDQISQQVQASCDALTTTITDVNLRECVKKSCEEGQVRCTSCSDPKDNGYSSGQILGLFPSRYFYLCSNNIGKGSTKIGQVAIHEWAHGCGWSHGDGKGVPYNDGYSSH